MIGRLRGTVAAKGSDGVLLDAGGVGFEVAMPPRDLGRRSRPLGEDVVVHTHLHVREDELALFGFPTAEERDLFRVPARGQRRGPEAGAGDPGHADAGPICGGAVVAADADTLTPGPRRRQAHAPSG